MTTESMIPAAMPNIDEDDRMPHLPADGDFAEFRRLWRIDQTMLGRLTRLAPIIERTLNALDESFYEALFTEEPVRLLMRDPAVRRRAIVAMAGHWRDLLGGDLKNETLLHAVLVGKRHLQLGVSEQYLLVASQNLLARIIAAVLEARVPDAAASIEAVTRMIRLSVSITMKSQAESAADAASMREAERVRANMLALEQLVYVDGLTGLFNRRHFDQSLAASIAHSLRHGQPLCLLMVDLDRFKAMNDRHGHPAGDLALKALGRAMADVLRQDDILSRFGGEEFAVILPETTLDQAAVCAGRIRAAVEAVRVELESGEVLRMTVSLGLALFDGHETAESLVAGADAALYLAKQRGRNRVDLRPAPSPF
jgi:diguanylate cyclase (GGDEF)-like protein